MRCTISRSLLATVYWSSYEDVSGWSKVLLESALECPYVYYAPSLLSCRLHPVTGTATGRVWYCSIDDSEARYFWEPRK